MGDQGYVTSIRQFFKLLRENSEQEGEADGPGLQRQDLAFACTVPLLVVTFGPSTKIPTATVHRGLRCDRKNGGVSGFRPASLH